MPTFGFIGFGNMAKMLMGGLMRHAGVSARDLVATRRDRNRLHEIEAQFPGVSSRAKASEVAAVADTLFLCVKPAEMKNLLLEIAPRRKPGAHLVSLAGMLRLGSIEKLVAGKVSRLMPTLTSEIGEGMSLICHNAQVSPEEAQRLDTTLASMGRLKRVAEEEMGLATVLTSCGPGLIAALFVNLLESAGRSPSSFSPEELREMVVETAFATAKLMRDKGLDGPTLIGRVATRGGITQEGVTLLNEQLPSLFDAMVDRILRKRTEFELGFERDFGG